MISILSVAQINLSNIVRTWSFGGSTRNYDNSFLIQKEYIKFVCSDSDLDERFKNALSSLNHRNIVLLLLRRSVVIKREKLS